MTGAKSERTSDITGMSVLMEGPLADAAGILPTDPRMQMQRITKGYESQTDCGKQPHVYAH